MSFSNTVKDGTGTNYWLLSDSSGHLITVPFGHSATQVTSDGNIKASAGTLYALTIAGKGVTAGDTVVIKDGSGGTTKFTFVFGAVNETIVIPLPQPVTFATAIYADVTISGGSVYVTGVYD
jgi:hypothetical protein